MTQVVKNTCVSCWMLDFSVPIATGLVRSCYSRMDRDICPPLMKMGTTAWSGRLSAAPRRVAGQFFSFLRVMIHILCRRVWLMQWLNIVTAIVDILLHSPFTWAMVLQQVSMSRHPVGGTNTTTTTITTKKPPPLAQRSKPFNRSSSSNM